MNPICFYHKADLDGVCSAAIVKHFVPDCELHGMDYGDEFPWGQILGHMGRPGADPRPTVYMVDFSLPPEDMKRLAAVSNLIWIDHHETAIRQVLQMIDENQMDLIRAFCKVEYAACELCWGWFSEHEQLENALERITVHGESMPEAVRLLGRYDVWDKGNPEWESTILPFQYGLRTLEWAYDPTSCTWETLLGLQPSQIDTLVRIGRAILRYQAEVNRKAMEAGAHEVALKPKMNDGSEPTALDEFSRGCYVAAGLAGNVRYPYRALACNTIVSNSQFFDGFYDPAKHDVMCAYCRLKNGKWKVSLYSTKPEIHCGVIAKTFGGGGHKGAAGFLCDKLPWEAR